MIYFVIELSYSSRKQPSYRSSIDSQPNGKKIGVVVTVTHEVRTVRKIGKDDLRLVQCQRPPVPSLMGQVG